ncbi:hypothetical protein BX666DRAFT_1847276 [Dichotomocladium elegans]|nr:hypothetical protein BX666DRAFT_1847276 [Dichotomocladium elegans]
MNILETVAVPNSTNIKTENQAKPAINAPEKEQSSGLENFQTEKNVADSTSQPSNVKIEDEGDRVTASSDPSTVTTGNANEPSFSSWAIAWDATSQAYYWWNTVTNETTWENPSQKPQPQPHEVSTKESKGTATSAVDATLDTTAAADSADAPPTPSITSSLADSTHTFYAHFNARTGKFQTTVDINRINPERMSIENRATRQMQYYFDVDAYMEQRNLEKRMGISMKGTKRRLTKKEIDRFKKNKQEKKMKRTREWLCD